MCPSARCRFVVRVDSPAVPRPWSSQSRTASPTVYRSLVTAMPSSREYADDLTSSWETQADEAGLARERESQAAQWNAEHYARVAHIAARFKSTCARHHGTYSEGNAVGNLCTVSFKDAKAQAVPIDENGDWDAQQAATNLDDCQLAQQDAASARADDRHGQTRAIFQLITQGRFQGTKSPTAESYRESEDKAGSTCCASTSNPSTSSIPNH
jgi:hypothetical protein